MQIRADYVGFPQFLKAYSIPYEQVNVREKGSEQVSDSCGKGHKRWVLAGSLRRLKRPLLG
jgi:hypothetical protein